MPVIIMSSCPIHEQHISVWYWKTWLGLSWVCTDRSKSFTYPQSPLLLAIPNNVQCVVKFHPSIHVHIYIQAEAVRQQCSSTADRQYKCYRNASLSLNVATVVLGTLAAVAIIPIYIRIVYPRMYSWTNCTLVATAVKTQQLSLIFHCQNSYHIKCMPAQLCTLRPLMTVN